MTVPRGCGHVGKGNFEAYVAVYDAAAARFDTTDVTGTPVLAGRFSGEGNFTYATLESAGGFDIFLLTLPQQEE